MVEPICGRFAEREELLTKCLAAAPNDAVVLFHASRGAYTVGRTREALGYMETAHRIDRWAQGENWYAVLLAQCDRAGADGPGHAVRPKSHG